MVSLLNIDVSIVNDIIPNVKLNSLDAHKVPSKYSTQYLAPFIKRYVTGNAVI